MEDQPTSDGVSREASRRLFERYPKIDDCDEANSSYDEEKFSCDLAECANFLSPDLVQVLTQPMTPEKERIDTENHEENEKIRCK